MYPGGAATDVPVNFQSEWISVDPNLVASRLHEILRQDVRQFSE